MSEEKKEQEVEEVVMDGENDENGARIHFPWGWGIAIGVIVILMIACAIVIANL